GCATAFELASRGARVTLIERAELAAGASGRNHGLLLTPLDPLLAEMARESSALYDDIADAAPLPIQLDRDSVGFVIVADDDREERAAARTEADAAREVGIPVEELDGSALREQEPALS